VADLGIADRITPDGGVTVGELARDCGVQLQPLMRVLQALAAFGVFAVAAAGSVAHTARSRLLRTDRPNSLHHAARFWTAPGSWRAWERLDVALTGGVPHEAACAGFVVAGDDDDRELRAGAHELALQIETTHPGHLQVEHQAVGRGRVRQRSEKVLRRCEGVGAEIRCA
jgi:hypothetical protein